MLFRSPVSGFPVTIKVKISWGTKLASLNWAYQINNNLYSSSTLTFSQYNSDISSSQKEAYSYVPKPETGFTEKKESFYKSSVYGSGITDVGMRTDFYYTPINNHYIRYGATLINHFFRPEHTRVGALEDNDGNKLEKEFTYANDYRDWETDRKSTRLNSSHITRSRMPSSA